jgi:hypothetical protein
MLPKTFSNDVEPKEKEYVWDWKELEFEKSEK